MINPQNFFPLPCLLEEEEPLDAKVPLLEEVDVFDCLADGLSLAADWAN